MLRITELIVSDEAGGIPASGDDAVHAVAFLGDASGDGRYTGFDASMIARVSVGLDAGFDNYPLIDPSIIGDTTNNGALTALDAAFVARKAVGLEQNQIPNLPDLGMVVAPPPSFSRQANTVTYIDSNSKQAGDVISAWDILGAPPSGANESVAANFATELDSKRQRRADLVDLAISAHDLPRRSALVPSNFELRYTGDLRTAQSHWADGQSDEQAALQTSDLDFDEFLDQVASERNGF